MERAQGNTNTGKGLPWPGPVAGILLLVAVLAGCIDNAPEALENDENSWEPTLETPPQWRTGQWWTLEVQDRLSGTTTEGTLVVTEATDTTASLGMPVDTFQHRFFIYHLPPLGEIEMDSFSWNVMGHGFEALKFPLVEGKEWSTVFHSPEYGWDVQAEVLRVDGTTAEIRMIGDNVIIDLTYDAEIGMISRFEADAYGVGFHVTDHGDGYEGQVRTPSDIDLGFVDGRVGTLFDASATPGAPIATLEVGPEVSHGTLALMVSGLPQLGSAGPGAYRVSATSPEGDTYEATFTPGPEDPLFLIELHEIVGVQGTWEVEFESAGPGWVGAELIVYDQAQVSLLPDDP